MSVSVLGPAPEGAGVRYVTESGQAVAGDGETVVVLAGAGRRIGARVVDAFVAMALCVAFFYVASIPAMALVDPDSGTFAFLALVVLPLACLVLAGWYHVTMTRRTGRTVGRMLFGLKVAPLWTDGTANPAPRAAVIRDGDRGWASVIPVANLLLGALYLSAVLRNGPYWHSKWDRKAGTVIIRWPRAGA